MSIIKTYTILPAKLLSIRIFVLLIVLMAFMRCGNAQINVPFHLNQARINFQKKEYQEAISWINKIIYYNPDHSEALLLRGKSKYNLADRYGAKDDFSKVLEIEPYHYMAYFYRGLVYNEIGQLDSAFKDIHKAIDLLEYNPDFYAFRGELSFKKGDLQTALSDYNHALELDQKNYRIHLQLGLLKLQSEEYAEAIRLCTKAISLKSTELSGYITRAKAYYMVDSTALALKDLLYVNERDTNNIQALYFLALTYFKDRNYNNSLDNYNKALKLNPYNAICYFNRGVLYAQLESYEDALFDFTKVLEINTKNIYAYLNRGKTKYHLKDYRGAEEDLSEAIALHPVFTDAYMTRAAVRYELKDTVGYFMDKQIIAKLTSGDSTLFTENIDSLYIEKITEFKADFTPINDGTKIRLQYITSDINMLPTYAFNLYDKVSMNKFSHSDVNLFSDIEALNDNYVIALSNKKEIGFVDSLETWNNTLDSLLENSTDSYNFNLLKGLSVGWDDSFFLSDRYLGEALKENPNDYLIYFIRGNHYLKQAEALTGIIMSSMINSLENQKIEDHRDYASVESYYFKAAAFYKKSLFYNSDFIYARYNKAYVETLLNNFSEAVKDYMVCIEQKPEFSAAYFNRGLIYLYTGNTSDGCQDLSKAGELGIEQSYNIIYKYCD